MSEQQRPGEAPGSAAWPSPAGTGLPAAAQHFPHAEPQPYHLMLRTWTYEVWKPLVGILLVAFGFLFVTALVLTMVVAVWAAFQSGLWVHDFSQSLDVQKNVTPQGLLGTNLGIASMILVTWFVIRVVHRMRPRWLTSVVPRMRWGFLAICLGLAVVALVAQILVGLVLPGHTGDDPAGSLNHFTTATALSALVVLLTTPLQAAGEEFLFRGYLLMAFGSLFRNKWVAILITATLFALAHGVQNFPLFFDRFAFGLIAGWLVTRTGGLEAGIALHILNNFLAFGIALAYGDLTSTLNVSSVSWWNIVLTVTQSGVYATLVVLVARRRGLQTRTRPPEPPSASTPGATSGPAVATA